MLFGMTVVDSWLAFTGCTNATETQSDFYTLLAEELIDNSYDDRLAALRRRQPVICADTSPTLAVGTGAPLAGVGSHITPTKRRKVVKGAVTNYSE